MRGKIREYEYPHSEAAKVAYAAACEAEKPRKVSGGRSSKAKGSRIEREVVGVFQDAGIAAERIPLSGGAGGSFAGDVSVPILGEDRRLEVKCRAGGFAQIYKWLSSHYGLVIRRDRDAPLIVLRLSDFAKLAIDADKRRVG